MYLKRDLTAALEAATLNDQVAPCLFFDLDFSGGQLYLWTGVGTIVWNGVEWTGAGALLSVSELEETVNMRAAGISMNISGIPSANISLAMAQDYQGRPALLYFGAFDTTTNRLIADPHLIGKYRMDQMELVEDGDMSSITLSAENELIDLERPREFRYTSESHREMFSGDTFCDYVTALLDAQIHWGQEEFATKLQPKLVQ